MAGEAQAAHELVCAHGGLVTADEALRAGWSRGRLHYAASKGWLIRLRQGVYTSRRTWDRAEDWRRQRLLLRAYQRVDPSLAGCGLSAAAALRLPLPNAVVAGDVVRHPRPSLRRVRRGETLIRLRDGLVLTGVVEVVIECARRLPIEWGLAVADAAIAKGLISLDDLQPVEKVLPVEGFNGPRGVRQARWVLEHARPKVESPLESLARAVIVLGGFAMPEPQVVIGTAAGSYRVDLLDAGARVITEADGKVKYVASPVLQPKGDELWNEKIREDALRDQDFEVVRFRMADFRSRAPFLTRYQDALTRARTLR